eukprot:960107-Pleurochrysis_carterae.AAC.1
MLRACARARACAARRIGCPSACARVPAHVCARRTAPVRAQARGSVCRRAMGIDIRILDVRIIGIRMIGVRIILAFS